jgi:hypothetical protein
LRNLGLLLALAGLALLLATTLTRQQQRRQKQAPTRLFILWQQYGTMAAYFCLMLGLLLLWREK